MNVEVINYTPNPETTIAAAARLCYSDASAGEIMNNLNADKVAVFINKLIKSGHLSPFEHVTFTFAVEGVSRALTHQLVRHRIASYSQKSQRYVSEAGFEFIMPYSIAESSEARTIFVETMSEISAAYDKLSELVPKEDARYVLPNACETKIVFTLNARSMMHFFSLRCCSRAQWEIRELANEMLRQVKEVAPIIFEKAGPPCEVNGLCPEGDMSCGKYPLL